MLKENYRNYINNVSTCVCCGFSESDKIEISESTALIDCETGDEMQLIGYNFIVGHTYRCEKRFCLAQGYKIIGTYKTNEQAREVYKKIVDGLRENNTVVDI